VEAEVSKGSSPRRPSVSQDEFAANWPKDWNARQREKEKATLNDPAGWFYAGPRCTCTEGNCLVCEEAK
jgi:hypothetical protein